MYGDYEGDADQRQHIIGARSRDSQCPGGNCEPELTEEELSNSAGSFWRPKGQQGKLHVNATGMPEHLMEQVMVQSPQERTGPHCAARHTLMSAYGWNAPPQGRREQSDLQGLHTEFVTTSTDDAATTGAIGGHGSGHSAGTAGFGHRDEYRPSKATR